MPEAWDAAVRLIEGGNVTAGMLVLVLAVMLGRTFPGWKRARPAKAASAGHDFEDAVSRAKIRAHLEEIRKREQEIAGLHKGIAKLRGEKTEHLDSLESLMDRLEEAS